MTPETALRVLLARCSVPFDHHVRGYFADSRHFRQDMTPREKQITGRGNYWGGCLMFVFECTSGEQGKAYGT